MKYVLAMFTTFVVEVPMSSMLKALERAISLAGSQTALAKGIGVSQQRVWSWLYRGHKAGADKAISIEKFTNGEVTRHQLRPDYYPE